MNCVHIPVFRHLHCPCGGQIGLWVGQVDFACLPCVCTAQPGFTSYPSSPSFRRICVHSTCETAPDSRIAISISSATSRDCLSGCVRASSHRGACEVRRYRGGPSSVCERRRSVQRRRHHHHTRAVSARRVCRGGCFWRWWRPHQ